MMYRSTCIGTYDSPRRSSFDVGKVSGGMLPHFKEMSK